MFSSQTFTTLRYPHKILICLTFGLLLLAYTQRNYLLQKLDSYGCRTTQEQLGAQPVAPEQEAFIKQIAQEMGVTEPIMIRKMNHISLITFGYHNAFACFPIALFCIPLSNTPFLFISEGFFEDLSVQEQRFLIGHELVHIKEHHTQYLNLLLLLLFFGLLLGAWFIRKYMSLVVQKHSSIKYHKAIMTTISCLLLSVCILIPELVEAAYRRRIEREADSTSLSTLQSYDGCIKLVERWEREFRIPMHNSYFGLFADHPSTYERKMSCLELKNKSKDTL